MKLYEIKQELENLISQVDADGEITEFTFDQIEKLTLDESEKLDGIACYIKELITDASAIKSEEETLKKRRQAKENHADRLKEFLSNYMKAAKKERFESPRTLLSFRKSTVVDITNESKVPKKYMEATWKILRADIKKELTAGHKVPGAILVDKENLQIK